MERKDNTLYGLLDSYTNEEVTFKKVTTFADNTAMSDSKCDGIIYRKKDGEYFKRVYTGYINVQWFGAKPDFIGTSNYTGNGTDNTAAVQKAVDYAIATNGGVIYFPPGKYLINGTIYVLPDPDRRVPISFVGNERGTRINKGTRTGALIVRRVAGDVFRININSLGVGHIPNPDQYDNFSVSGISFLGIRTNEADAPVLGMRGFNIFRTRSDIKSVSSEFFDYSIYQGDVDASGNENYCDGSNYDLIVTRSSTFSAVRLYLADSSTVKSFYFENPYLPTNKFALEVLGGTGFRLIDAIIWTPAPSSTPTPISGSRYINIGSCKNPTIIDVHIERVYTESAITFAACKNVTISNVHNKYTGNALIRLANNDGVTIVNLESEYDLLPTKSDIEFFGFNNDVSISKVFITTSNGVTERALVTLNAANSILWGLNSKGTADNQLMRYDIENVKVYEIDAAGNIYTSKSIGVGVAPSDIKNDIIGATGKQIRASNTIVDLTNKVGNFIGRHYNNAKRNVLGIIINSQLTLTEVGIGGGSDQCNAATQVRVYAALDTDTAEGTPIASFTYGGLEILRGTFKFPQGNAGSAPAVLPVGTVTTAAVDGAFEYNGVDLYFTSSGVRRRVGYKDGTPFPITNTSQQLSVNRLFIPDNNTFIVSNTMPLEADSIVGDKVLIAGRGTALWRLLQNAGQVIHVGAFDTTVGTGGSLTATNRYDTLVLQKIATNEWTVISSTGNLTRV